MLIVTLCFRNLNPLGSRLEIQHTITWIKTHLQEDPEVSLPKQDVYEQYMYLKLQQFYVLLYYAAFPFNLDVFCSFLAVTFVR